MRAIWIDQGAAPQTAKLAALGITRVYFDARDTPRDAGGGMERGVYRVQSWDGLGPVDFARALSADVTRWGGDPVKQLAVHANIELHDPHYIADFLHEWRRHRPKRETALVVEGLQGGWLTQVYRALNADGALTVMAEAYTGDMGPLDADAVRSNLVNYGVARAKALVMYDAARLASYWDGAAFTQQRLP